MASSLDQPERTVGGSSEPSRRVTVAIATYNGRDLLARALDSLAGQTYRDFDVLVVDDASSDGTAEWLAQNWSDAHVIVHEVNKGVTSALNAGLRAGDGELVFLLNNDVELHAECLRELVRAMDEDPGLGSACPKLLSARDREILDGAGDVFRWIGYGGRRGHGERDLGQYDREQPIFGACGGAAMYRRSALQTVGLLDEDFYAIYEDLDWSFRAQLAGFGCRYVPSAIGYHVGGATLGSDDTDHVRYLLWRNGIWLVLKDYPLPALLWQLPRLTAYQLDHVAVAIRERKLRLLARVWRDALGGLPRTLRKRFAVQRTRRVSLRQLAAAVRDAR